MVNLWFSIVLHFFVPWNNIPGKIKPEWQVDDNLFQNLRLPTPCPRSWNVRKATTSCQSFNFRSIFWLIHRRSYWEFGNYYWKGYATNNNNYGFTWTRLRLTQSSFYGIEESIEDLTKTRSTGLKLFRILKSKCKWNE